ncbi:MAG TPA: NADH:ubiquinone reductase (Na(+)-transporting) subunit C [Crocinitomix sp.]|nr:NADH:ubiquinone reductase (Na(+)-transporting) subunit C [Crocinitomix sp.]
MAINKDSNGYTFLFAIVLVVVVGVSLAAISVGLKPIQTKNLEIKKKMDILGALKVECTRKNAEEHFSKYINLEKSVVIDANGNIVDGKDPFNIDIKKQYRDKTLDENDRVYPLFVGKVDGKTKYIIPLVGTGLWGPIWGYLAINDDKQSIYGAVFDHKTETPGLGAEIKTEVFTKQFIGELISDNNQFTPFKVVKDGSGSELHKVDGITGGTITSKGVEKMLNNTLEIYVKYFNK